MDVFLIEKRKQVGKEKKIDVQIKNKSTFYKPNIFKSLKIF